MVPTKRRTAGSHESEWNDQFLAMLPQISRNIRYALRFTPHARRDEDLAECVANAFCAFVALARRGKSNLAFASVLARYALKRLRDGRKVGSRGNSRDLTSDYARRRHHLSVLPLLQKTEDGRWENIIVEDKRSGPAEVAATRLDFTAWLQQLGRTRRAIAKCLAAGDGTAETAKNFQLTDARISQLRRELRKSWEAFQGEHAILNAA